MAGNKAGGYKAAATNKRRYGEDFYENIGRKGGRISSGGGFASVPGLAQRAGTLGGLTSRRRKREVTDASSLQPVSK